MDKMKEIVAYCAANIVDWDLKSELAVRMIGRHMKIDPGFSGQIEEAVAEWFSEHNAEPEEFDVEEIVLWAE